MERREGGREKRREGARKGGRKGGRIGLNTCNPGYSGGSHFEASPNK
jgi:hypothetical protein